MVYMFDKRISFAIIIIISLLIGLLGTMGLTEGPLNSIMKNIPSLLLPIGLLFLTASYYAFKEKSNIWKHEIVLCLLFSFLGFSGSLLFSFIKPSTWTRYNTVGLIYLVIYAVVSGVFMLKARKINPNSNYWKFLAAICFLSIVGIPFIILFSTGTRITCYEAVRPARRIPPELAMGVLFSLRKKRLRERLREEGVLGDEHMPEEKGLLSRWFE